jgi:hypothetical protein
MADPDPRKTYSICAISTELTILAETTWPAVRPSTVLIHLLDVEDGVKASAHSDIPAHLLFEIQGECSGGIGCSIANVAASIIPPAIIIICVAGDIFQSLHCL